AVVTGTLDVELLGTAEAIEVVDIERAEVYLQRIENLAHGDGHRLGLDAINVQVQPRRIGPEAGEQSLQADNIAGRGHDLVGHILQRLQAAVAAVLDDDLESSRRPHALHSRVPDN